MKLLKLALLIICTNSLTGHAQLSQLIPRPRLFPEQPPLTEKDIAACENFFRRMDEKYKLQTNFGDHCSNEKKYYALKEVRQYVETCLASASANPLIEGNFMIACLDVEFRGMVRNKFYNGCLAKSKQHPLTKPVAQENCLDLEFRQKVSDDRYFQCLDYVQENIKNESTATILNQCSPMPIRNAMGQNGFRPCMTKSAEIIPDFFARINYCTSTANQTASNLEALRACNASLMSVAPKNAGSYCIDLKNNLSRVNPANIACLKQTAQSLYGQYLDSPFRNLTSTHFQEVLQDCDKKVAVASPGPVNKNINFIGVSYIHHGERYHNTQIGGLSGLEFDPKKNLVFAVSDDPGRVNSNRVYAMEVNLDNGLKIDFRDMLTFDTKYKNNQYGQPNIADIDAEGIAFDEAGNLIISSETLLEGSKSLIKIYNQSGKQISEILTDNKYLEKDGEVKVKQPQGNSYNDGFSRGPSNPRDHYVTKIEQIRGLQPNKGFESLAVPMNNRKILFTANEAPIVQDTDAGNIIRISKFEKIEKKYELKSESLYELEDEVDNGVVDILAVDEYNLIVLERSFNRNKQLITSRLYKVSLTGAKDYKEVQSLDDEIQKNKLVLLNKELILNLGDLKKFLPAGFKAIDNIEGISYGPISRNGKKTILLISDNNMNANQMTQMIALEIN